MQNCIPTLDIIAFERKLQYYVFLVISKLSLCTLIKQLPFLLAESFCFPSCCLCNSFDRAKGLKWCTSCLLVIVLKPQVAKPRLLGHFVTELVRSKKLNQSVEIFVCFLLAEV